MQDVDLATALRPLLVVAQGASILITWPLWQARESPPLLPVVDALPQIDVGIVLLATLALILIKPEAGVIAHSLALVAAFTMDQTRLQPEFISITLLLLGTTRLPYARSVAGAHLVSLWFWAGLNKALSLGFMEGDASFLFSALPMRLAFLWPYFGWLIIASEISISILLLIPRLRRTGVIVAVVFHLFGLLSLFSIRWNPAVWPWNVALALGAVAFFWRPQRETRTIADVIAVAVFALIPIGFYGGYVDAYVAHNLYTSNTATAQVCSSASTCSDHPWEATWERLRVPLPPEPRLFRSFFLEVCRPGETLVVYPRRTRVRFGRDTSTSTMACPEKRA